MRDAFRQRGFPRLFAGLTTSALGDWMMLLVLSIWVKTLTGSNSMAGLTFFFVLLPSLLAPVFGVWIDRVRRRPLLVRGHVASAVAVLPLTFVRSADQVWLIWTVGFLYGISMVVLPAAVNGLLKEMLREDLLVSANASIQTTREALRLGGPLLGAAIFAATGAWLVAVVDAVSFLVAAVLIAGIRVDEDVPQPGRARVRSQLTSGVSHLVRDRVLIHMVIGFGLMLLVIGFAEASVYAVLDGFDKPPTFVAVVTTLEGVGAVVGGVASSRVIGAVGEVATAVAALVVLGAALLTIASTAHLAVMLVAATFIGMAIPPLFVGFNTLVQKRTPQAIMGRVSMAVEVFMGTPQAISMAAGAALVAVFSYRTLFAVMGAVTLLGAAHILVWLRDQVRVRPRADPVLVAEEP